MSKSESELKNQFINQVKIWASNYAKEKGLEQFTLLLTDLHEDEAIGFLKAIKSGILVVNDIGGCELPNIHRADRKPTEPSSIFGKKKENVVFITWREYVTQVGAVATLVTDYGWPVELVALDPRDWTFDVAGLQAASKDSFMVIAGEAKKTKKELLLLLKQMNEASYSKLSVLASKSVTKDGHKKYMGLLQERPLYFWAMAPGINKYFKLSYEKDLVIMNEIETLPNYSTIKTLL